MDFVPFTLLAGKWFYCEATDIQAAKVARMRDKY